MPSFSNANLKIIFLFNLKQTLVRFALILINIPNNKLLSLNYTKFDFKYNHDCYLPTIKPNFMFSLQF